MIIPSYNSNDSNDLIRSEAEWNEATITALKKAIGNSIELYQSAIEYLTRAMLLYQPKTAEIIESSKSESKLFWVYTAESLFDSAVLLAFGLYDSDKNIPNLLSIQNYILLLKRTNPYRIGWNLDPCKDVKNEIDRIKNIRNKNIAHHERKRLGSMEWGDIVVVLEYAKTYMQKYHLVFEDTEYDFLSIYEQAKTLIYEVFDALGVENNNEKNLILDQLAGFIETTKKPV